MHIQQSTSRLPLLASSVQSLSPGGFFFASRQPRSRRRGRPRIRRRPKSRLTATATFRRCFGIAADARRPPSNRRHSCAGKQETRTPRLPRDPETPTPRRANDSFRKNIGGSAQRRGEGGRGGRGDGWQHPPPLPARLRRVHWNASHAERSPPPPLRCGNLAQPRRVFFLLAGLGGKKKPR